MYSLQPHHTFALPASAHQLVELTSTTQLETIDFTQPFFILGEGSNSIFLEDFIGTVIKVALKGVEISSCEQAYQIRVAAGENWHALVMMLLEKGINGLENLALIPGTVGACPVQNIGAYGVEVAQFIEAVNGWHIPTRTMQSLTAESCHFAYRDSIFKHALKDKFIITEVVLRLPKKWSPELSYGPLQQLQCSSCSAKQVAEAVIAIRQSKLPDPAVLPNAGSFFKNPIISASQAKKLKAQYPSMPIYPIDEMRSKLAAGWLIDQAGLKGTKRGGIRVYEKQALVLVNSGSSESRDLIALIKHIQHSVLATFGVTLEHEVRLLGQDQEVQIKGACSQ